MGGEESGELTADTRRKDWSRTLEEAGLDFSFPSSSSSLSLLHYLLWKPRWDGPEWMDHQLPKAACLSRNQQDFLFALEDCLLLFLCDTYQRSMRTLDPAPLCSCLCGVGFDWRECFFALCHPPVGSVTGAVSFPLAPGAESVLVFDVSYLEERAGDQVVSPLQKPLSGSMPILFYRDGRAADGAWDKNDCPGPTSQTNELISTQ